ncbi:unnamed protein product [Larinioides sclopetarius]|uniref:Uncharacterized protein n=1 Tax=Larinioides sclopetarius TaxID=280406 RepID=A0AAV1ZWX5_9ARAC
MVIKRLSFDLALFSAKDVFMKGKRSCGRSIKLLHRLRKR